MILFVTTIRTYLAFNMQNAHLILLDASSNLLNQIWSIMALILEKENETEKNGSQFEGNGAED